MTEKRFKSRCYEKEKNVVIYDEGNKLFDVSYRDFEDAFYLKMKLIPVIDKLNELAEEKERLQYFESLYRERNLKLEKENKELRILITTLKEQNQKFKARLNDLGVEYL